MIHAGKYHGGLVFLGPEENALEKFSQTVATSLEDYGHPVERQSVTNPRQARITGCHYAVNLSLVDGALPDEPLRHTLRLNGVGKLDMGRAAMALQPLDRLQIELCPVCPGQDDRDISELLLVVMLYRLVDCCRVEMVEWLDPSTVLTLDQFLAAFVSPSPADGAAVQHPRHPDTPRFAPVDATETILAEHFAKLAGRKPRPAPLCRSDLTDEEKLALVFRTDPDPSELEDMAAVENAQSDIRRLASWGMTGVVAFISAPVAISLAAVNLIRGEDFRLNTHVLSLTGFLSTMQSTGAVEAAVAHLPL